MPDLSFFFFLYFHSFCGSLVKVYDPLVIEDLLCSDTTYTNKAFEVCH